MRQVANGGIGDGDGLFSAFDSDVDVESINRQPPGEPLEFIQEVLIALAGIDLPLAPMLERVCAGDRQMEAYLACHAADLTHAFVQIDAALLNVV